MDGATASSADDSFYEDDDIFDRESPLSPEPTNTASKAEEKEEREGSDSHLLDENSNDVGVFDPSWPLELEGEELLNATFSSGESLQVTDEVQLPPSKRQRLQL